MIATTVFPEASRSSDELIVEAALQGAFQSVTCYRLHRLALRLRVIDPKFGGLSQVARSELLEPLLESLPHEIQEDLFFVLLLAPEEVELSSKNDEFEHPSDLLIE